MRVRDATKFSRAAAFGRRLPTIRRAVRRHLERRGLPREKVLATIVNLLHDTLIRVGNPEYARDNSAFGLTTLMNEHVQIDGTTVQFRFCGKSGKEHIVDVRDRRLARIVSDCLEIPGEELFQVVEQDGTLSPIDSGDVNAYLREIAGEPFTSKDFRTWGGTLAAARALADRAPPVPDPQTETAVASTRLAEDVKAALLEAFEAASAALGNTVAVCRSSYVHPAVGDAYASGDLVRAFERHRRKSRHAPDRRGALSPDERALLDILEASARRPAAPGAKSPRRPRRGAAVG
jgi:DNA topoisomerase-1